MAFETGFFAQQILAWREWSLKSKPNVKYFAI
jgi:hypothetical protein